MLRAILAENFGRVLTGNMTLDFEDEFENDLIDRYHKIGANVINFLEENNDDKKEEKKLDLLNSLNDIARTAQDEVVLNVAEAIQENSEESSKHKIVSKDEETDMSAKKDVKFNSLSTKSVNELMAELNELVGLKEVKDDVSSMINLLRIKKMREEKGFRQDDMSMHLVFSGNPGTGKTTVARLLSSIYRAMGFLEKGHLVEVDRSGLVGGYVGQTALKVQEVVNKSLDGILFIDEAYALTNQGHGGSDSFGIEAVNTLLKAMEDNRNRLVVIIAGYPDLMESFLSSNPGMKSRFNKHLFFADYQPDELLAIFELLCNKGGWILQEQAKEYVKGHFSALYANRGDTFANGRDVRNYFEKIVVNHANRTAKLQNIKDSDLNLLLLDDVQVKSGITISSDVDGSSGDTQNYQNIPVADNIQINPQVHNQLQSVDGNIVDNASDCHKFIFYPEFNEFPWQATLHNSLWRNRFMGSIANYKITENAK